MMPSIKTAQTSKQLGFIAVFLLVAILMSTGSYFAIKIWGGGSGPNLREQRQLAAFKLAKEALLAYVVAHGRFPCAAKVVGADIQDKEAWPNCSGYSVGESQLGLLPWRYLNLDPAANPELCLWYAVSGHMIKTSTWAHPVNTDSHGAFKVVDANGNILQGDTLATNAAVVLIAANAPITSAGVIQNRSYTGTPNENKCQLSNGLTVADVAKQYLDTASVGGSSTVHKNWLMPTTKINPNHPTAPFPQATITTFVQGYKNSSYSNKDLNDHLSWITVDEFAKAISQSAANKATLALSRFYQPSSSAATPPADDKLGNRFYPYASNNANGQCVGGLLAGNLPKLCNDKTATKKSWTEYYDNSPAADSTLQHLIDDEWDQRLWYQLSEKCKFGMTDCAGSGNFLQASGGLTDLHTSILVAPRGATLPYVGTSPQAAKSYTR